MKRTFGLCVLFVLIGLGRAAGDAPIMKLDEVRPGMKGVLRTVFEGTKLEDIPVEVVDVIRRVAPGRDVIVIRLLGERIKGTGVARGMSGSPVYIDGKIIGALSFAWPFLKEPVAGLTPIELMMRVKQTDLEREVARNTLTWRRSETIPSVRLIERVLAPRPTTSFIGPASMRVLKTPIGVSGFSKASTDVLSERLRLFDVTVVQGGGAGAAGGAPNAKLEPGGPLCVQLIRGDLEATAVGTVTEVAGNRVYAFGHPMLGAGRIDLPMATGRVHMVVPSQQISFKLSSADTLVGKITLDHVTGIVGEIGKPPKMLPVTVDVRRRDVASVTHYDFEVIRDRRFALSLINAALTGTANVAGKPHTQSKVTVKATIDVEGYKPVEIADIYGGPQAPMSATGVLVMPLGHLLHNPFTPVNIKSIRIDTEVTPGDPRAVIRYAETDKHDYQPGDEVDVSVTLQPWREKVVIRHYKVKLPEDLGEGKLTMLVCDAATDSRMESGEMPHLGRPENVEALLEFFRRRRPSTHIVFRLSRLTAGMALEGRELPELPASVISVLGKQPPLGVSRFATPIVTRVGTEFVIMGRHQLQIQIVKH